MATTTIGASGTTFGDSYIPSLSDAADIQVALKALYYGSTGTAVATSGIYGALYTLYTGNPTLAGNVTLTGDLAVNGGDITTTSTGTATVFNTNATTVQVGNAATTVSMGGAANASGITKSIYVGASGASGSITNTYLGSNTSGALGVVETRQRLKLRTGTATAATAPLYFTAGTNLTTPEAGAVEYDGNFYASTSGGRTSVSTKFVSRLNTAVTATSNTPFGAIQLEANYWYKFRVFAPTRQNYTSGNASSLTVNFTLDNQTTSVITYNYRDGNSSSRMGTSTAFGNYATASPTSTSYSQYVEITGSLITGAAPGYLTLGFNSTSGATATQTVYGGAWFEIERLGPFGSDYRVGPWV
jgi:hypothetical protein